MDNNINEICALGNILQDCHCLNSMREVHGITSLTNALQMKNKNYSRLFD